MRRGIVGVIILPKFFNPLVKAIAHFVNQTSQQKRFSSQVQAAIMSAHEEALRRNHDSIETGHLLLSIKKVFGQLTLRCDKTWLHKLSMERKSPQPFSRN
jgi:hypothetical protein